jgi:hypothetical protein
MLRRLETGERVTDYDETQLGELLAGLPPAPEAWVRAAQELPLLRLGLEDIVERAREDEAFRRALIADLESALEAEGFEPDPALVDALRHRFSAE